MVIDLRVGERLSLSVQGDPSALSAVVVEPEHKTGALVRLRIVAPPEVRIQRERPARVVPSTRLGTGWQSFDEPAVPSVASMAT
jgi:hypothetical protein